MSHSADIRSTFFEFNEAGIFSKDIPREFSADPFESHEPHSGPWADDLYYSQGLLASQEPARHVFPTRANRMHVGVEYFPQRNLNYPSAPANGPLDNISAYVNVATESIEPMYMVSVPVERYVRAARWVHVRRHIQELEELAIYSGGTMPLIFGYITPERPFKSAFDRLDEFRREETNWDGYGGRPASGEVVEEVSLFLTEAEEAGVPEPSLVLGNDGSVASVWQNDSWYITAVFSGMEDYIYVVSKIPEITASGSQSGGGIAGELYEYLIGYSREDGQSGV